MARYISTLGTASLTVREISTTANINVSDRVLANTTGAAFTVTLPVSTTLLVGDQIQIIDITGTFNSNNLTVARNGALIQGVADNLTLDVRNALVSLLYTGATYGWVFTST
jgi:hypothetical protein